MSLFSMAIWGQEKAALRGQLADAEAAGLTERATRLRAELAAHNRFLDEMRAKGSVFFNPPGTRAARKAARKKRVEQAEVQKVIARAIPVPDDSRWRAVDSLMRERHAVNVADPRSG